MIRTALLLLVFLCACERAKEPIDVSTPTDDDRAEYDQGVGRLLTGHVYGGFGVVSRRPDGSAEHQGEALIWGGTALWTLPCDKGQAISAAMRAMVLAGGGALERVSPIGEYADGRQITMDGALGLFLGVARRVTDCGEADLWREPLRLILAFQDGNGGRMHPGSAARIHGEFTAVRDLIASAVGLADRPSDQRFRELEQTIGGWATAVQVAHDTGVGSDACFRVNLGLTSYLANDLGGVTVSQLGRDQFCAATKTMDIPTADHWCGRKSLVEYLANYVPDVWEFRHQRCGAWESPDGDGNKSPELDRLVALVMAHGWRSLQ